MSTAEQIIAEHRTSMYVANGVEVFVCRCGKEFLPADEHAAHVVAALTNAGKTIVELPEAEMRDCFSGVDGAIWKHSTLDIRVYGNGINVLVDDYEHEASIESMESLGLILLAGARQAREWAVARVAEGGERGEATS